MGKVNHVAHTGENKTKKLVQKPQREEEQMISQY